MIRNLLITPFLIFCLVFLTGAAFQFGGIKHDTATITSAGTTAILGSGSKQVEVVTGTSAHTVQLPAANTLREGYWFHIKNQSTGIVTVTNNSGTSLTTLLSAEAAIAYITSAASAAGVWSINKISPSPLASKGQLLVTDGSTLAALPVGSNNQVLTLDSAQTYGVKWASGGGGSATTTTVAARLNTQSGGTCPVDSEAGTDWINGTPTSSGNGLCVISFNSGIWAASVNPTCVINPTSTGIRWVNIAASDSSSITTRTYNSSSALENAGITITCSGTSP